MKKIIFKLVFFCLILNLMSIIVYADDEIFEDTFSIEDVAIEASSDISDEPPINARHAIVFDRHSKKAIYSKKINETCKMASTTKIMTAIIVIENSNLNDIVEISSKSSGTGGSRLGLSTNDKISVENLLYGLMLKSGNDAAVALAEYVGGNIENFALMMNNKAKELNMLNTNFVTPHGLDNENHYTTALDLAILADYALKNQTFSKIVNTKTYTIFINNKSQAISNTNELLGNYKGLYGVKTGFTNGANRCLVTSCKRNELDFICIVLGCDTKKDRTRDTVKLLNYSFKNFSVINSKKMAINKFNEWVDLHKSSFYINKGKTQNLNLYLDENDFSFSSIAVKSIEKDNINIEISFNSYFEAPLEKNAKIGTLQLFINNSEYYNIDILNNNKVEKKTLLDYFSYIFRNYYYFFALK